MASAWILQAISLMIFLLCSLVYCSQQQGTNDHTAQKLLTRSIKIEYNNNNNDQNVDNKHLISKGLISSQKYKTSSYECASDYECKILDKNAACTSGVCVCAPNFVSVVVPDTTSSSAYARSSNALQQLEARYATQIKLSTPATKVVCMPKFQLADSALTCYFRETCCTVANSTDPAFILLTPPCALQAAAGSLDIFGDQPPALTYTLDPSSPAGVSIDPTAGAITLSSEFNLTVAKVNVQVVLATQPAQMVDATVTLVVNADSCCNEAPAQKSNSIQKPIKELFLLDADAVSPFDIVLADLSGANFAPDGASLPQLFTYPCAKALTTVSAALVPNANNPLDICQFLNAPTTQNGWQITGKYDPSDPTSFSPAFSTFVDQQYAAFSAGGTKVVVFSCAFTVKVESCNGLQTTGNFLLDYTQNQA